MPGVWVLYLVAFPVLSWWLPGWAVTRWQLPNAAPLERFALSLLIGLVLVVPLAFTGTYLTRTPLTPWVILAVSAAITGYALWMARRQPRSDPPPDHGERAARSPYVVLCVLVLAAYTTLTTEPRSYESAEVWAPCPHQSAQLMLDDGTTAGLKVWDPQWEQSVCHVTSRRHEPGYGLFGILNNQRVGSMATIGQVVAFHGTGGLVVTTFCYDLLVCAFAALLAARRLRQWWAVALVAGLFLLGTRAIAGYMVNECMLGLALGLGALHVGLRLRARPSAVEAALLAAVLALSFAVRPVTVSYLPGILWLVWPARKKVVAFAIALAGFALPWLIVHAQNFGDPVYHPAAGRGMHDHVFMGLHFRFHPLNWPIHDQLVRPAHEPLPLLFQTPLEHIAAFGALFWTLTLAGAVSLGRRALAPLLMIAPTLALLLLVVNLDHEKLSYGLLVFPPLPLFCGAGIAALVDGSLSVARRTTAAGLAVGLLVLLPAAAGHIELAVDHREQYSNEIGDDQRTSAEKLTALTTVTWLPRWAEKSAIAWSLLTHAEPPQLATGEAMEGAVFVWRSDFSFEHTLDIRLDDAPRVPVALHHVAKAPWVTRTFVMYSLRVGTAGEQIAARLTHNGAEISLALTAAKTKQATGYLTLVILDRQLPEVKALTVTLNDKPLPVEFFVTERADTPDEQVPQLITNLDWFFHMTDSHIEAVVGQKNDVTECQRRNYNGFWVGRDANTLVMAQDDRRVRVRRARRFPSTFSSECEHLSLGDTQKRLKMRKDRGPDWRAPE